MSYHTTTCGACFLNCSDRRRRIISCRKDRNKKAFRERGRPGRCLGQSGTFWGQDDPCMACVKCTERRALGLRTVRRLFCGKSFPAHPFQRFLCESMLLLLRLTAFAKGRRKPRFFDVDPFGVETVKKEEVALKKKKTF